MRSIHGKDGDLSTATLAEVLRAGSRNQMVVPSESTWGAGGYNQVWIEGSNSWLVRHVIRGSRMMVELARSHPRPSRIERKALDQAAREILLAQSSDWPFMMKTGQASDFASLQARVHLGRFFGLARDIDSGRVDQDWLADIERRDNVFPNIDYEVFA
jgi:1,4-alpha-glucan branching enzyme